MTGGNPRDRIGVVTGGDHDHMLYLDAQLRSIAFFNDLQLEIYVMDFGFTKEDVEYLQSEHNVRNFLSWREFEPRLAAMRSIPEAATLGHFEYVYAISRKLAVYTIEMKEYMLWIDADCVVLEPLSSIVGGALPEAIRAARNPKWDISSQFMSRHDVLRDALARSFADKFGLAADYARCSFNSGVLLYKASVLKSFVEKYSDAILSSYGPYIWGDQGFVNLCCSLEGTKVESFDWRINACFRPEQAPQFYFDAYERKPFPAISCNAVKPFVYHFLYYKPAQGPFRKDKVLIASADQKLFDMWRTLGLWREHARQS
jgi:lipopolysaccharide biosynthesis glycosyltransferase